MIDVKDRDQIELIGRQGAGYSEKEDYFICKTLDSFYICVDKNDHGYTPHAKNDGYWESWITFWMIKNVKPGSLVADIGANHGYYSLLLANNQCIVHAFEPQKYLCNFINKSVKINDFNIEVFNKAVSDTTGVDELIIPIHHGMNATITKPGYMPDGFTKEKVETISLDDIEFKYDFIKIDAEGGERKIWNGMKKFIKNNPSCVYLLEWRYDRYDDPEEFAREIFEEFDIKYVDFFGKENELDINQMLQIKHEDWMLVLRNKNEII